MVGAPKKITGRFYAQSSGRKPVRDWLMELSRDDRRQIGIDIQRVEFGWPLGMPYCRSLGSNLWEVRSNLTGGRIARVIFCIHEGKWSCFMGSKRKHRKRLNRTLIWLWRVNGNCRDE